MRRDILVAALALITLYFTYSLTVVQASAPNCTVILYGVTTCPHCRATHEALKKLGLNVTFVDVASGEGRDAYLEVFKKYMLVLTNRPGVPLTYVRCGSNSMLIMGEVLAPGYTPADEYKLWAKLLDALSNGVMSSSLGRPIRFRSVICIAVPTCNSILPEIRKTLLDANRSDVAGRIGCLAGLALCLASNETIHPVLPSHAREGREAHKTVNKGVNTGQEHLGSLMTLLPLLVGLALFDAINPCFLTLYALTIASIASLRGRRAALATGFGVALGVFTGYYLLGLGVVQAAASIPSIRYALATAVIAVGLYAMLKRAGLLRVESESCMVCRLAAKLGIGSANMTPFLGYLFGLVASLTLLPCSAGPYFVAALYLSHLSLAERLLGLLAYNIVFIAPIVAMALAAGVVAAYEAARRVLEPLTGPLLVALGVYILVEPKLEILLGFAAGR